MRLRAIAALGLLAVLTSSEPARAGEHLRVFVGAAPATRAAGPGLEGRARGAVNAFVPAAAAMDLPRVDLASLGDGTSIVRFEQTHLGLPVVGRGAVVRLDAAGRSVLTSTSLATALPQSTTPAVSAVLAAATAQSRTPLPVSDSDAHLVFFPSRGMGEARLAWVIAPAMVPGLPTAPRVMVDALTGVVLEARDMVVFLDQAKVYPTNPVKSPTLANFTLNVATGATTLKNAFIESSNCIDKKTVKSLSFGGIPLSVHTCDLQNLALPDANGDYLVAPGADTDVADAFSEVSMFHHASRVYEFFAAMQGSATAQVVVDKPFRTISNLQLAHGLLQGNIAAAGDPNTPLDPFQNAFFSPAGGGLGQVFEQLYGFNAGAMWFGQGPRKDYSYDGDVVYHEFTHAVVDKTLKLGQWHIDAYGAIDAPGAMNEGLADYFSSALAGDPNVGEYASKDISPSLDVIRTLDNTDSCPKALVGEVHYDSTLFSGGLWSARASLADDATRLKYDTAIYKAMLSHVNDGDLGYQDLVNLFIASLQVDLPAGAAALTAEMTKRGVLPGCTRVLPFAGAALNAPVGITSPGAYAAPGKGSVGATDLAPGMLQVSMDVPANTDTVTVTFQSKVAAANPNPLGGGGTPFTPVVLAKAATPIAWTTTGKLAHDATVKVDATGDGGKTLQKYTAVVTVPDGATKLYVQIASKGDNDGSYNTIALAAQPKAAPEPVGADDAGTGAAPPGNSGTTTSRSGCSCRSPGGGTAGAGVGVGGGLGVGLGALLSLGAVRRRRRRG